MMEEAEARGIAAEWLSGFKFECALELGRAVELPRSWVLETVSATNEVVFGNAPVVVDKRDRTVNFRREAWREFARDLSGMQRLKRWWHRREY
jgi:hypothetical protein